MTCVTGGRGQYDYGDTIYREYNDAGEGFQAPTQLNKQDDPTQSEVRGKGNLQSGGKVLGWRIAIMETNNPHYYYCRV